MMTATRVGAVFAMLIAWSAFAQPPRQTQADDYTRYELLAPGSGKFRILYEVTATTPGATEFFNAIRRGSVASDERVVDVMTGKPLAFDVVGGTVARGGGVRNADSTGQYIRVTLARRVPQGGEARILIDKTYYDTSSYRMRGDTLLFDRPLGIKRNAIVLPAGYELVSSNFPSQILREADGRLKVSFWNNTPSEAPVQLRARPSVPAGVVQSGLAAELRRRLDERSHQTREIVYFLQQPETHAFDLYHDYTETRTGIDRYLNVVRAGSTVSSPRAVLLDTGEELRFDIQRGDSEVVVFHFPAVKPGESLRLRMFETYTDTARYKLVGDELVWDRSFGRPANAVVLPAGWALSNSSIPATVTELPDGRIRLDFINPRPDEIAVLITARRRSR
ncbi:MAG TPA: hypothetical protein VFT29_07930 [Gemmatimonadaceae bacterium]|nr:hypothetical protein [Gemmatimonadaceae bacterium]